MAASGEFTINIHTIGLQFDVKIAALPNGYFVAVWIDQNGNNGAKSDNLVKVKVFDAMGVTVVEELLTTPFESPTPDIYVSEHYGRNTLAYVAPLADGGFIVSWWENQKVRLAQIYDSSFQLSEDTFSFELPPDGEEIEEAIDALLNVRWNSPVDETVLANGLSVRVWRYEYPYYDPRDFNELKAEILNADGNVIKAEFLVNTITTGFRYDQQITALANGGFVVVWRDLSNTFGDDSISAIHAKVFDANGDVVKDEFLVNDATEGAQHSPIVTSLADGGFVIAWEDDSVLDEITETGAVIKAKVFDAQGDAIENILATGMVEIDEGSFQIKLGPGATVELPQDSDLKVVRDEQGVQWLIGDRLGESEESMPIDLSYGARKVSLQLKLKVKPLLFDDATRSDGSEGDDNLVNIFGNKVSFGGKGNDRFLNIMGVNRNDGNAGDDIILGGFQNDHLLGGRGEDVLVGDISQVFGGSDTLDGGTGHDLLMGGIGADTFVFRPAGDTDTIAAFDFHALRRGTPVDELELMADFTIGQDKIQLKDFAEVTAETLTDYLTSSATGAVFSAEGTTIYVHQVDAGLLSADDFIFV